MISQQRFARILLEIPVEIHICRIAAANEGDGAVLISSGRIGLGKLQSGIQIATSHLQAGVSIPHHEHRQGNGTQNSYLKP